MLFGNAPWLGQKGWVVHLLINHFENGPCRHLAVATICRSPGIILWFGIIICSNSSSRRMRVGRVYASLDSNHISKMCVLGELLCWCCESLMRPPPPLPANSNVANCFPHESRMKQINSFASTLCSGPPLFSPQTCIFDFHCKLWSLSSSFSVLYLPLCLLQFAPDCFKIFLAS